MSDESMSIEDLEARQYALTDEIRAKQQELRAVAAQLDLALSRARLERDLASLEKKHGVQIARPAGIASTESVNGG